MGPDYRRFPVFVDIEFGWKLQKNCQAGFIYVDLLGLHIMATHFVRKGLHLSGIRFESIDSE